MCSLASGIPEGSLHDMIQRPYLWSPCKEKTKNRQTYLKANCAAPTCTRWTQVRICHETWGSSYPLTMFDKVGQRDRCCCCKEWAQHPETLLHPPPILKCTIMHLACMCMWACAFWKRNIYTAEPGTFFWTLTMKTSACAVVVVSSLCSLRSTCLCLCECLREYNVHLAPHHPRLQEAALFLWRGFCLFGSTSGVRQRRREGPALVFGRKLLITEAEITSALWKKKKRKWGCPGLRQVKCFCWRTWKEPQPEQRSLRCSHTFCWSTPTLAILKLDTLSKEKEEGYLEFSFLSFSWI